MPRPQRRDAEHHRAVGVDPLRFLAGQYRDELGRGLLRVPRSDRPGYSTPTGDRPQRLWLSNDALWATSGPAGANNPQAVINAMTRLANQNLADADLPAWVEFALHSHLLISKRVAMAQSFRDEE